MNVAEWVGIGKFRMAQSNISMSESQIILTFAECVCVSLYRETLSNRGGAGGRGQEFVADFFHNEVHLVL